MHMRRKITVAGSGALSCAAALLLGERDLAGVVVVGGAGEAAACRALLAATGFPRRRVVGAGGIVAAAHLRALLADELGLAPCDVSGMALGGSHEDAFVASATVSAGGVPVDGRADAATLTERLRRTLAPGPYARAAAVREVAESILLDRRRVLPRLALSQGEDGLHGLFA